MLGSVLSAHSKRRDEIVWLAGLRGKVPEEDISLKGICEINISNNNFDDQAIKELC